MKRWRLLITYALFSWVLWMDQSVYGPPHGHGPSHAGEGASSGWQQLAVVPTKGACEALRRERVEEAVRRDAAADKRGRYPERFRYFCSPIEEDTTTR
jgi:hypothetical protein